MKRKIRQVAIIGSGIMGGGIAALFAGTGIKVLLLDILPFDLKPEEKKDIVARNKISQAGLDNALSSNPSLFFSKKDASLISIGNLEDDIKKLGCCDLIIEAVVENLDIKRDLFKKIEKIRKKDCIVATNTSGIVLKEISKGFSKNFKEHFLGIHFFNPVRYMHLLELICDTETLPEVFEFITEFGEKRLGKGIIRAKDTPNFVGNRIGIQGIGAIIQAMVKEEMSIPQIDSIFGAALGRPKTAVFKTVDIVGLDTLVHVCKNSFDLCPNDEQRDVLILPDFIEKMIEKNLLGKKTNAGFYKTDLTPEWKRIRKVLNWSTMEYEDLERPSFPCIDEANKKTSLKEKVQCVLDAEDKAGKFAWKMAANSFAYAANRIPEIADTIIEIDNAMKWGYNFEMGPFELWDAYGVKKAVERMEKENLDIPLNVKEMLETGHTSFYKFEKGCQYYYDFLSKSYKKTPVSKNLVSIAAAKSNNKTVLGNESVSLVDIGDDVFCFEFHTKMNSLNNQIIDTMDTAIEYVDKNGAGLVIGNEAQGMPAAFSAGADLAFVLKLCHEKKYSEIDAFVKKGQDGIQRAKYSPFPIVAAPFGLTFGGACEICLGVDRIVAHAELYMGLVEIGVGLIPAGTGTMNLWKKYINALPEKTAKTTDLAKIFVPAFMKIAMAAVSMSAVQAQNNGFLSASDRIVFNRDHLIGEAKKEVLRMVDNGYAPPLKKPLIVMGEAGTGMVNAEIYNMFKGKFISEYDAFLAKRIAYVMSGGNVSYRSEIDEDIILKLEREAFVDFCKEEKTMARIDHILKTGKPLRN